VRSTAEQERLIEEKLRAGAPVQATMPVRKPTALEYAFEQLLGTLRRSGGEH